MYFLMNCSLVSLRELAVRGSSGHAAGERPEDQSQHLHAAVPAGGKKFWSVPPLRSNTVMRVTSYWWQRENLTYTPCSGLKCQFRVVTKENWKIEWPLEWLFISKSHMVQISLHLWFLMVIVSSLLADLPFFASCALLHTQKVYTKAHSSGSRALCEITKCICSSDNNAGS